MGKRQFANTSGAKHAQDMESDRKDDVESGVNGHDDPHSPRIRRIGRFRDAVNLAVDVKKRNELKQKLHDGVDSEDFTSFYTSKEKLETIKEKKMRQFYEKQNATVDMWIEVDTLVRAMADDILDSMDPDHDRDGIAERSGALQGVQERVGDLLPEDTREERARVNKRATWAININVIANIILLIAKGIAALRSSSLSLIASLVDSALDLLCTLIVYSTNKLVQMRINSLSRRFPVGRRRLEPLGILVFSVIMVVSFIQVLKESIEKLSDAKSATNLPPLAIGALAGTVVLKGIIWIGCARIKTTQVQALAQDCKTDVYFNTLSLLFPLIGYHANVWWLDPLGAAFLSLFIIYDWASTFFEHLFRLAGSSAELDLNQKLLFLAYRFAPVVAGFKAVTAYHAGDGIWAEFDILLDPDTKLHVAHDIGETLQYCAEGLGEVDRAFVTTDYTSQGPSGHTGDRL